MNATARNSVLNSLARLLEENRAGLIEANAIDLSGCPPDDPVIVDRLKIDDKKIDQMIESVRAVLAAPDQVGAVIYSQTREDGLRIENRKVPFGTVLIIFEARPDVCIEAASIAIKAGNRILLKGGKEARNTNLLLVELWRLALEENAADTMFVRYLDLSREETQRLIAGETDRFDLVIPRGGESLIDFAVKHSKAPVLVSGRGNNFLYIDEAADPVMALKIALDGKTRLSVCNALDKIVVHKNLPDIGSFTHSLAAAFSNIGVEVYGEESTRRSDSTIRLVADEQVWYEEFLSAKLVIGTVEDLDDAVAKINRYSGGHSAAIVTANAAAAEKFLDNVDCAAVYHNASVRFTDGSQFGLGAEIAISTQKLHFRGPLGSEHLMTNKWFVFGDGQVRG